MPKLFIGDTEYKLFLGDEKIRKAYLGSECIYSAGAIVTYIIDNGESYSQELDDGANALTQTGIVPEKEGWVFAGWSENIGDSNILITKNVDGEPFSLYAVFKKEITLSYNKNGGNSTPDSSTDYAYYNNGTTMNPTFTLAEAISRSGCKFNGWALGSAGGTLYKASSSVSLEESTTFYAAFSASSASGSASANWSASDISSGGTRVIEQWFTFPIPFDHIPSISTTHEWGGYNADGYITIMANNVSKTGFRLTVDCWKTGSKNYGLTVYWTAT